MSIVERNVSFMLSDKGMEPAEESIGGNAGMFKFKGRNYSCIGVNFFFDCKTGQIFGFSNKTPTDYCSGNFRVIFARIGASIPDEERFDSATGKIVDLNFWDEKKPSKEAKAILLASVEEYNGHLPVKPNSIRKGVQKISFWSRFKSWFS